jgi:hypothetical protein
MSGSRFTSETSSKTGEEDSESPELTTTVKKKQCGRKPSFRPEYMPGLRVLKNDIRRRYGEMYINVTNSHDPSLINKFFYQFCLPDCRYDPRIPDDNNFGKFLHSLKPKNPVAECAGNGGGVSSLVYGVIATMPIVPDMIARLLNFQVRITKGESGSRLTATIVIQGSQIYEAIREPEEVVRKTIKSSPQPGTIVEFAPSNCADEEKIYFNLLSKPIPLSIKCSLTMNLDDNYRIKSFLLTPDRAN